jgi:hypothetical protein
VRVYALDDFTVKVLDEPGVRRVVVVAGGYIIGYLLADVRAGGVRAVAGRKVGIDFRPYIIMRRCGYVVAVQVVIYFLQDEGVAGFRKIAVFNFLVSHGRNVREVDYRRGDNPAGILPKGAVSEGSGGFPPRAPNNDCPRTAHNNAQTVASCARA